MKRYKVTGSQPVDVGHEREYLPGDEFSAKLAEPVERFMLQIGALTVVNTTGKAKKG
jgi:hypothetical protein